MSGYLRLSIAKQIIIATVGMLVLVFGVMTITVQLMAASAALSSAEADLSRQVKMLVATLDSHFEGVKARAERQSKFFAKHLGGEVTLGSGRVKTGDVELPALRVGNEVINGNPKALQSFKDLTSDEAAAWLIRAADTRPAELYPRYALVLRAVAAVSPRLAGRLTAGLGI